MLSQQENEGSTICIPVVRTLKCLRERNYGSAEGKAVSELNKMAAAVSKKPPAFVPKGAETLPQIQQRVKEFMKIMYNFVSAGKGEELFELVDCFQAKKLMAIKFINFLLFILKMQLNLRSPITTVTNCCEKRLFAFCSKNRNFYSRLKNYCLGLLR